MKCDNTENNSESLQYLKQNVIKYYLAYVINTKDKKTFTTDMPVMSVVGILYVIFPIF